MKKALFICNFFAPENKSAAIRTTNLAAALKKNGYDVIFLAEECNLDVIDETLAEYAKGIKVIRTGNSKWCKNIIAIYKKIIAPFREKAMGDMDNRIRPNKDGVMEFHTYEMLHPLMSAMDMMFSSIFRQYDVYMRSRKRADALCDVDVIISSFGSYYPIFLGYYLKKKHPDIPWVVDIRDSIYQHKFISKYLKGYSYRLERKIAENAERIVTISKGIRDGIEKRNGVTAVVITNGYNKRDREKSMGVPSKNKFMITFTGALYGGCSDISPAFKAVKELIDEGVIEDKKVFLSFAGGENVFEVFKGLADRYKLGYLCEYLGYLTRKETLDIQTKSHILLVAAYDDKENNYGVITGKVYEYMSSKRPVVAIVSGSIENSELGEIVKTTRIGFVYEESNKKKDEKLLKEYIKDRYGEFMRGEDLLYNPNEKEVEKYSHDNLGKAFVKLVDGVVENG